MSSNLDTFEKWEKQGLLKEKLKLIEGLVSENVTHEKIALRLGISQKTLNKMKNKHIEFARAFSKGETILKDSLISAIYKKAMGFHEEDSQTLIEDVSGKQKRKVVKTNKYYPPDLSSAKYLLIVKFGRSFNDKKEELDLMEKRIESKEDVWSNEGNN